MNTALREILDLTKDLIRFHSTAGDQPGRTACADFIADWLTREGLDFQRVTHQGVDSLLALPGPGRCKVLLMAHFDVVDGPVALFTPREADGRLHGRGAIDDKYAVALAMVLAKRQKSLGLGAQGPLGILLSGDEEVGGRNGAQVALAHVRADYCIALDGGNPTSLITKEKGVLRLKLIAQGKAAHGARPWLGVNAIELLAADLAAVRALFTAHAPDHWHRTLNIGTISGGTVVNMVPARAEALLDIRYTEADDPDALLEAVRGAAKGQVELVRRDSIFDGGASPYLDRLLRLMPGSRLDRAHGASDARFLSDHGILGVVWGAEGGGSQHSEDEYLEIASLERLHEVLVTFLDELSE